MSESGTGTTGNMNADQGPHSRLERAVGLAGAVVIGLGSILGTGVFVSVGIAAGYAGPAVVLAIVLAAIVAGLNGLNSAQLAANHPVSGGTYEYGYRWLHPTFGFTAGWLFVGAKSASAAAACLGVARYVQQLLPFCQPIPTNVLAMAVLLLITLLVLAGLRRSNWVNLLLVSITLFALLAFVLAGLPLVWQQGGKPWTPFWPTTVTQTIDWPNWLQACALLFVAYTGYGRVATMGEEVVEPRQTIPRAIILTLLASMTIYLVVAVVAVGSVGAAELPPRQEDQSAVLVRLTQQFAFAELVVPVVGLGATTAMLGVLLNLLLGVSRVLLAMARRGDLPTDFAKLTATANTPANAVVLVTILVGSLILAGNLKSNWSFSALTVLIYYAITNWAALQLVPEQRLFSPWLARLGLLGCLSLAIWVDATSWLLGTGWLVLGLLWHWRRGQQGGRQGETPPS